MAATPGTLRRQLDQATRERLAALAPRIAPGVLASERVVPVHPALEGLLPQGLVRGSTLVCTGSAASSLAVLSAVGATQAGAWVGVAGLPTFGVAAWREAGGVLERVVVVRQPDTHRAAPEPDTGDRWGAVVGALIDGFEVVIFGAAAQVSAATARRLQARLQARGGVLVLVGAAGSFSTDGRLGAEVSWHGLGLGHGSLRARRLVCSFVGRRAARPRRDTLWFPNVAGRVERVLAERVLAERVPAERVLAERVPADQSVHAQATHSSLPLSRTG